MENTELMARGQELHDSFIEADDRATAEQRVRASAIVEQHLNEYGWSYAEEIQKLMQSTTASGHIVEAK